MDEFILNKQKNNGDKNNERNDRNKRTNNGNTDENALTAINLETMLSENDTLQTPSTSASASNANKHSQRPNNIKDINFWKSVFFNNKNNDGVNGYNSISKSASDNIDINTLTSRSVPLDNYQIDRKARKHHPNHSSNTAILLNSIITNLNERHKTKVTNDNTTDNDNLNDSVLNNNNSVNNGLTSPDPIDAGSRFSADNNKSSRNYNNSSGLHISNIESLLASTPSYTYLKSMKHKSLTPTKRKSNVTSFSSHQGESDRYTAQNDLSSLFVNNANNTSENGHRTRVSLSAIGNVGNNSQPSDDNLFLEVCISFKMIL